jgi:heme/copper-type cytochrome/quinol oxidase subunit 2
MSFRLADAVFWIAVACCTVAHLAILRSIIRTKPAPSPALGPAETPLHRAGEILWAVVPAVALAGVLIWTWRVMHAAAGGAA